MHERPDDARTSDRFARQRLAPDFDELQPDGDSGDAPRAGRMRRPDLEDLAADRDQEDDLDSFVQELLEDEIEPGTALAGRIDLDAALEEAMVDALDADNPTGFFLEVWAGLTRVARMANDSLCPPGRQSGERRGTTSSADRAERRRGTAYAADAHASSYLRGGTSSPARPGERFGHDGRHPLRGRAPSGVTAAPVRSERPASPPDNDPSRNRASRMASRRGAPGFSSTGPSQAAPVPQDRTAGAPHPEDALHGHSLAEEPFVEEAFTQPNGVAADRESDLQYGPDPEAGVSGTGATRERRQPERPASMGEDRRSDAGSPREANVGSRLRARNSHRSPLDTVVRELGPLLRELSAEGAEALEGLEVLADWYVDRGIDAALPVIGVVAARAAFGAAIDAMTLSRAARRQLLRVAMHAVQALLHRYGPRAIRALPPITTHVARMAARRRLPLRALPQSLEAAVGRAVASPELVRRLGGGVAVDRRSAETGAADRGAMGRARIDRIVNGIDGALIGVSAKDGIGYDRATRERAGIDRPGVDWSGADRSGADRSGADRSGMDSPVMDRSDINEAALERTAMQRVILTVNERRSTGGLEAERRWIFSGPVEIRIISR